LKIESRKSIIGFGKLAAAAGIYAAFAVYLYLPQLKNFDRLQYLLLVNACLASLGCFVLSRRWVGAFWGSFFAGAVYGFGPFTLWLSGYHEAVGLLAATIPWLFCPAAFGPKTGHQLKAALLSVLPFLVILLFFQTAAYFHLFPIPISTKLHLADLAGLLAPLVAVERSMSLVGFYHVPIAAMIMGFSMLLAARRLGIMAIAAIGVILAFCDSFLNISPIIWLTISILSCSVLIGVGMQGLILAGYADRKWLLLIAMVLLVLALAGLLLATKYYDMFAGFGAKYAKLLVQTAKMYILAAIAVGVIFFMARAKLHTHSWQAVRWIILSCAVAIDIFLAARTIVDALQ